MKEKKIIIGSIVVVLVLAVIAGVWVVLQPKEEKQNMQEAQENQNLLAGKEEDPSFNVTLTEDGTTTNETNGSTTDTKIEQAESKIEELTSPEDPEYPLFSSMMNLDAELLQQSWNVDASLLDAYIAKMPMMNVKANLYAILKPVEGKAEEVKAQMDAYLASYEEQWARYLPDQYELVQNRVMEEINGYLVYVISEDNEAFLTVVRQALQ